MSQRPEENYGPPSPRNSFALIGPDPSRSMNTIGQVRDGFLSESDMAGADAVRDYPDLGPEGPGSITTSESEETDIIPARKRIVRAPTDLTTLTSPLAN